MSDKAKRSVLLPERHQGDFFVCDILDAVPKDDMGSMEHPMFTLSTKPDTEIRSYSNGDTKITITPSVLGIANIHDKDILIYCISQIVAKMNKGEEPGQIVCLKAYDLLYQTNRETSGDGYKRLHTAFDRLSGTRITTTILTGGHETTSGFGLIDSWEIIRETRDGRMIEIQVKLSDWLYRAIQHKEVLTIHRDYFKLRKPLERRTYEIARKHCGKDREWKISLEKLHQKSGSRGRLNKFRWMIKDICKHNHLPDYNVTLDKRDIVTFTPKVQSNITKLRKPGSSYTVDNLDGYLDPRAYETCRDLARQKNRDWYVLKSEFVGLLNDSGDKRENISASFIAFIKQKKSM